MCVLISHHSRLDSHNQVSMGTAIVTGGCGFIGRNTVISLIQQGLYVVVAARPESVIQCENKLSLLATEQCVKHWYNVEPVDLSNSKSVNTFVHNIESRFGQTVRALINAAAAYPRNQRELSSDGFEMQLQVNVWSYYTLMKRLMPLLAANAPSAIVNVASTSALYAAWHDTFMLSDLQFEHRAYDVEAQYEQTKAAEVILSREMARRHPGVSINAIHPGLVWLQDTNGDQSGLLTGEELTYGCGVACTTAETAGFYISLLAVAPNATGRFMSVDSFNTTSKLTDISSRLKYAKVHNRTRALDDPNIARELLTYVERMDLTLRPSWQRFNSHVISSPFKMTEYENVLAKCVWSPATSVAARAAQRSTRVRGVDPYCYLFTHTRIPVDFAETPHDLDLSCLANSSVLPVHVCHIEAGDEMHTITRLGPFNLPPGGDLSIQHLPLAPTAGAYLVESLDIARDGQLTLPRH